MLEGNPEIEQCFRCGEPGPEFWSRGVESSNCEFRLVDF